MERKEGDTYKYGAYFNRIQTSYTCTDENGQSLECFCIIEISLRENSTVALFNQLSSTNQASSQAAISKI